MSLPSVTNRQYFSATLMNAYSESLLTSYAWAIAPRAPFSGLREAASGTNIWTGFVLYTGDTDTFRYRLNHTSSGISTIKINGSTIATPSGSGVLAGTVSISGLGLTAGTVYSVTLSSTATCDPQWLGLSKTINYTAPPTFSNGATLTAAQINTLRTGLSELETAWAMPHTPNILARLGSPGAGNGYQVDPGGTSPTVFRGFFYHTHNTLRYRIRHGTSVKKVLSKIYVNNVDITGTDLRHATTDYTATGTYDLSGLGLTLGNFYEIETTVNVSGTSDNARVFQWMYQLTQESGASVTPPPVWAHGGTNVTHTNLNRYSTIIDAIHPGSASKNAPLFYEQPALQLDTTGYRYYIQHRRKWLRYRIRTDVAGKTAEIYYGPNLASRYALDSSSGNHSFDMSSLPRGMGRGQYYLIEDVEFSCETDTAQP
jgi:hypothetical protein